MVSVILSKHKMFYEFSNDSMIHGSYNQKVPILTKIRTRLLSKGLLSSLVTLARDKASFIPSRNQCFCISFHWQSSSDTQHRAFISSPSFLFVPLCTRENLCLAFTSFKYLYTYVPLLPLLHNWDLAAYHMLKFIYLSSTVLLRP